MSRGVVLAEEGHIVNILPPIDITGGKTGDIFSMALYAHVTIIIQIGVSSAAFTKILVNECTNLAGAGATAIAFKVYKEETAAGDTLGARTAVTAAGLTPNAADTIFYVIELDTAELSTDSHFVQLSLTNTTNSVIASAVAILTGPRFADGDNVKTVIA